MFMSSHFIKIEDFQKREIFAIGELQHSLMTLDWGPVAKYHQRLNSQILHAVMGISVDAFSSFQNDLFPT